MKLNKNILIIACVITLLLITNFANCSKIKSERSHLLTSLAKQYVSLARYGICGGSIINGFHKVSHHVQNDINGIPLSLTVLSNNNKSEIAFIFSGYNSQHINIIQSLYDTWQAPEGTSEFPNGYNNPDVEYKFVAIYNKYFRQAIILNLQRHGSQASKYIFIGHSFGGAIATITADDLYTSNLLTNCNGRDCIQIFTYGSLQVGNENFINNIEPRFTYMKVSSNNDILTKLPRCVYVNGVFNCYKDSSYLVKHYPTYYSYFSSYYQTPNINLARSTNTYVSHNFDPYINSAEDSKHTSNPVHNNHGTNLQHDSQKIDEANDIHAPKELPKTHDKSDYNPEPKKFKSKINTRYTDPQPLRYNSNFNNDNNNMFLEKRASNNIVVRPVRLFSPSNHFTSCTNYANYWSCPFRANTHQVYYGTNVEVC